MIFIIIMWAEYRFECIRKDKKAHIYAFRFFYTENLFNEGLKVEEHLDAVDAVAAARRCHHRHQNATHNNCNARKATSILAVTLLISFDGERVAAQQCQCRLHHVKYWVSDKIQNKF